MQFVVIFIVLTVVVVVVAAPLRQSRDGADAALAADDSAALLAAREAKYREIRDAQLDHLTGKLSDDDYAALDGTLRREAVHILERIDERAGPADDAPAAIRGADPDRAPTAG